MGGWEVAAPVLRLGRAGFIRPLCKNGDATRGRAIYTWWTAPRASRLRRARDGSMSCVMGGTWAKPKIRSERLTTNVLRAQLAHQRSYVLTPPPDDRAFDVNDACARVHPR